MFERKEILDERFSNDHACSNYSLCTPRVNFGKCKFYDRLTQRELSHAHMQAHASADARTQVPRKKKSQHSCKVILRCKLRAVKNMRTACR